MESSNYSLNNSNQNTVEDFISNVYEIKKCLVKNNVDYFDKLQKPDGIKKNLRLFRTDIPKFDGYKKKI